jgi:pimeloyl-ACP methyl ester carboxylesterase
VLAVFALIVMSGITLQGAAEANGRKLYPAPGSLVDLGDGRLMHMRTWGAGSPGRPTIVLEASAGMFSSEWAWVAADLSRDHRVVAVDRPALGWSIALPAPRDAGRAADALSEALDLAGVEGPFVVVGHSFGGFTARVFADLRRVDLAGLVLIDSTHPDGGGDALFKSLYRHAALIGHTGINQLRPRGTTGLEGLPADEVEPAIAVSGWTSHLDGTADEMDAWDTSTAQVRAAGSFDEVPVLVLTGPAEGRFLELQRDLLGLSGQSSHVELQGVGHISMLTDQAQSQLVIAELRRFLSRLD